jgi:hypothetical protein
MLITGVAASSTRTSSQVNHGPGNDPSATSQANVLITLDQASDSGKVFFKDAPEAIRNRRCFVGGCWPTFRVPKEKMDESNTKVSTSLIQLGKNYQALLEDIMLQLKLMSDRYNAFLIAYIKVKYILTFLIAPQARQLAKSNLL